MIFTKNKPVDKTPSAGKIVSDVISSFFAGRPIVQTRNRLKSLKVRKAKKCVRCDNED